MIPVVTFNGTVHVAANDNEVDRSEMLRGIFGDSFPTCLQVHVPLSSEPMGKTVPQRDSEETALRKELAQVPALRNTAALLPGELSKLKRRRRAKMARRARKRTRKHMQ